MKFTLLLLSIILLSCSPGLCQRRNPWRGPRQGGRRQAGKEERVRGMRSPPLAPNYNPVPNNALPVTMPCQKVEPPGPKLYEPPQLFQNVPKMPDVPKINVPIVPNVECAQNVVLSPNLQLIQTPQVVPNPQIQLPVPNVAVPNVPVIQAQNMPQYVQNVQLVPNIPLIPEIPVPSVPLLEVPTPAVERIRMHIPHPSVEPLDRFSSCFSPPLESPYLPAASPVSAFSPPNILPPLMTSQSRSHFLRKIPIPPPTL